MRRSLTNIGGPIQRDGDATASATLVEILELAGDSDVERLTHQFHTYPARMHPLVARGVLGKFTQPGQRVIESLLRQWNGFGGIDGRGLALQRRRLESCGGTAGSG